MRFGILSERRRAVLEFSVMTVTIYHYQNPLKMNVWY